MQAFQYWTIERSNFFQHWIFIGTRNKLKEGAKKDKNWQCQGHKKMDAFLKYVGIWDQSGSVCLTPFFLLNFSYKNVDDALGTKSLVISPIGISLNFQPKGLHLIWASCVSWCCAKKNDLSIWMQSWKKESDFCNTPPPLKKQGWH